MRTTPSPAVMKAILTRIEHALLILNHLNKKRTQTFRAPKKDKSMIDIESYNILDSVTAKDGTKVEILEIKKLKGSSDLRVAESLFFAAEAGLSAKMIRITINNSKTRVEAGALYFMRGDLEMKASTGGGILKGLSRKMLSGESFFVNEIHGTGEIWLEPTFGHFILHQIENGEGIIVDKSMFYAGTSNLDISAQMQKNVSSAVMGGEGLFQTKIAGEGIAILYSTVPQQEILKVELNNEKLSVDGNFAMMRTDGVTFRAEKSSKSWLATSVSGEGLLQTFNGTGMVWIAPTEGIYEKMATPTGLKNLANSLGTMGTKVGKKK